MKLIIKQTEIVIDGNSYQVDYTYYPEIPKMAYDYDGGGHPGQDAQVELHKVKIKDKPTFNAIHLSVEMYYHIIPTKIIQLEKENK